MRVVIVTESFPPDVNGVAHCAQQTARHLAARGHEPLVVAPAAAGAPSEL
jgi:phosphatidylinositol alpha 1,6-mannosyltransferase